MDWQEATRLVFSRVQALDPENVSKIIGWLLMQNRAEQEMLRLALASEIVLQSLVGKARKELGLGRGLGEEQQQEEEEQQQQQQQQQLEAAAAAEEEEEGGGAQRAQQPVCGGAALQQHLATVQLRAQGLSIGNPSLSISNERERHQSDLTSEEEKRQQQQQTKQRIQAAAADLRGRLWTESGGASELSVAVSVAAAAAAAAAAGGGGGGVRNPENTTRLARFPTNSKGLSVVHSPSGMLTSTTNLPSHPLKLILPSSQGQSTTTFQQHQQQQQQQQQQAPQQQQQLTLLQQRQLTVAAAAAMAHQQQQQQQMSNVLSAHGMGHTRHNQNQNHNHNRNHNHHHHQQEQTQLHGDDLFFDTEELFAAALNQQSPSCMSGGGGGGRISAGGGMPSPLQQQNLFAHQQQQQLSLTMDNINIIPNGCSNNGNETNVSAAPDSQSFAWKPCLYFAKGYCKHGTSCRFLHGSGRNGTSGGHLSSVGTGVGGGGGGTGHNPTSAGSPGSGGGDGSDASSGSGTTSSGTTGSTTASSSLQRLEGELYELLKGRRTPVSIASLPQLYYERFGKSLQAEGYLTESQRHGKAGYSLTKLLARLKDTVTLIDRPHGQHAVVLSEDAHKHLGTIHTEREESSRTNNSSARQIYLTFPADSTFTEDDVSAYFRGYGPVQDVRIPFQQKRMFGFVTFQYASTVKLILSERNPHFICNARVLVKPYREKKQLERMKSGGGGGSIDVTGRNGHSRIQNDDNLYQISEQMAGYQMEAERLRMAELRIADMQTLQMVADDLMNLPAGQARTPNGSAFEFLDTGMFADDTPLFHSRNPLGRVVNALEKASERVENCRDTSPHSNGLGLSTNPFLLSPILRGQMLDSGSNAAAKVSSPFSTSLTSGQQTLPSAPPPSQQQQQQQHIYESGSESRSSGYCGLGTQSLFSSASTTPISGVSEHDLTCPICLEYFTEPVELDCSHTFCEMCISQVMRANKECPICRRQVGPHILKYLEMKDTHACLQSVLRGVQSCW